MSRGSVVLIGGGVRSGKSRFALTRALELGAPDAQRLFIATAEASDDEMRARIHAHRAERRSPTGAPLFETIEEPLRLAERLESLAVEGVGSGDVVLVDCLTLWLSNVLLAEEAPRAELEARATGASKALAATAAAAPFHIVFVTNEVGMGLVPPTELGRVFRDAAGRLHQELGARADELYLAALGRMLRLVPGPVEVVA